MSSKNNIKDKILIYILVLSFLITIRIPLKLTATDYKVNLSDEYKKTIETDSLTLYCNEKIGSIAVKDKESGYVWKSSVEDGDGYNFENTGIYWKQAMSSLFLISYTNLNKKESIIDKTFSTAADDMKITYSDNKVILEYGFSKLGIKLTVEILLEGNDLIVRIPADKIEENSTYGLISLELMPFFGAADSSVDGYIFYPDGCGAIMKYENLEIRPKASQPYKAYIYSPEEVNINLYERLKKNQEYQASLPLYGIKNGENAFLAVITEGEEEAAIQVYPQGYQVDLNWASFEFVYRHFYNIILSNITINGVDQAKKTTDSKPDKKLILEDHEVRFMFLRGHNANYSGMANAYRDFLVKNNAIKKSIKNGSKIPLSLGLFMGIKEERMIFDRFISMTNFKQAELITKELINNGVEELDIKLKGWSKGGYGAYPVNWPPERKLGGISGMNNYLEYAKENHVKVFLQASFIKAMADSKGYSKKDDIVIQGNQLPLSDSDNKKFLLNPFAVFERFAGFIKNIRNYSIQGLAIEDIGELVYHDYNKKQPSSRSETIGNWENILNLCIQDKKEISVSGGNAYVLKYADRLFNVPIKNSNYNINDETIPFFQMVVHGMIPYTSEPGNLFHDPVTQKLKWVEYGCVPFFELTYESAVKLKHTDYNQLLNSYYINWIDKITEIYLEFNQRLKDIWCENIVEHQRINPMLVKVLYSNGNAVYINYDDKDAYHNGYMIKALDYLVLKEGGGF